MNILTAAHCLDGAQSVESVAGAHRWREDEPNQQRVVTGDVVVHEDWGRFTISNDIALARLSEPLDLNGNYNYYCTHNILLD